MGGTQRFSSRRWGIQITWPEVRFKRCQYSGRRDYYATGATTIRLAWGPGEIYGGLSLLGFGIGAIYLPNNDTAHSQKGRERGPDNTQD